MIYIKANSILGNPANVIYDPGVVIMAIGIYEGAVGAPVP